LAGHGGDQHYRPHAPDLPALAQRNPDDLDAAQLDALMNAPAALPTDPDRLERLVRAYAKTKDPPLASMMFNQLTELAGESWGSAALRAAAYRVLARVDGVELVGEVRDPLGRRGVALVAPVGYTDQIRSRLIIDPHSGDVLATETLLARRADWIDAAPGAVVGQVVYVDSGWINEVGAARSRGRASRNAPATTAANASTRRPPKMPDGTGSSRTIVPAAIGSAFVKSVARPATVSAPPTW
jgi:hypothetical protein